MDTPFSHLQEDGHARMVNVGDKPLQRRRAVAEGALICDPQTIVLLRAHALWYRQRLRCPFEFARYARHPGW